MRDLEKHVQAATKARLTATRPRDTFRFKISATLENVGYPNIKDEPDTTRAVLGSVDVGPWGDHGLESVVGTASVQQRTPLTTLASRMDAIPKFCSHDRVSLCHRPPCDTHPPV